MSDMFFLSDDESFFFLQGRIAYLSLNANPSSAKIRGVQCILVKALKSLENFCVLPHDQSLQGQMFPFTPGIGSSCNVVEIVNVKL